MKGKFYDRVRIMGADLIGAFNQYTKDNLCNEQTCMLVGDQKNGITLEKIKTELAGKINKDTQIELLTHGEQDDSGFFDFIFSWALHGHYQMVEQQTEDNYTSIRTSWILKTIDQLTPDPVQIYMGSCSGGAANNDIAYLKPGSILVTLAEPENMSSPIPNGILTTPVDKTLSPEEKFWRTIKFTPMETSFNMKLQDGTIFQWTYSPFHKHETMSGIETLKDYIIWNQKDFEEKYTAITGDKFHFTFPDVTDEEAQDALLGYVGHLQTNYKLFLEENHDLLKLAIDSKIPILNQVIAFGNSNTAIQALLEMGASLNIKSKNGFTPLKLALSFNKLDTAKILIKHGADVNNDNYIRDAVDNDKDETVEFLLANGANPNGTEIPTPLEWTICSNKLHMAKALLEHGANPLMKTSTGATILDEAKLQDKLELAHLMEEAIQKFGYSSTSTEPNSYFDHANELHEEHVKLAGNKNIDGEHYSNDDGSLI